MLMQPRTVRERIAYIFLEADLVHLAGLSGTAATLWGLVLLNPYAATFPTSKDHAFMASLFPEWVWGAVVALAGLLQVLSTLDGSARGRLVVSAVMCAL